MKDYNDDVVVEGLEEDCIAGESRVFCIRQGDVLIGEFVFDVAYMSEDDVFLIPRHLNIIDPKNRHLGYGLKAMEQIHDHPYTIRCMNIENNIVEDKNDIHYSDEGQNFINKCIERKLIEDPYASESDYDDYN